MERFPTSSIRVPYFSTGDYRFETGFGFHIPSAATNALRSRLVNLVHKSNMVNAIVPAIPNGYGRIEHCRRAMRHVQKREAETRGKESRQVHTPANTSPDDVRDLDQLFLSVSISLDPVTYNFIIGNTRGGGRRKPPNIHRLPFQQFMMLGMIVSMIHRSGLDAHIETIMMHIKKKAGFDWLTGCKMKSLLRKLKSVVVGHNVGRRMGKSVQVYADILRMMVLFPRAGIKCLYTVHTLSAAQECLQTVKDATAHLITIYNIAQKKAYDARVVAMQGVVDEKDFYYVAFVPSSGNLKVRIGTTTTLTVYFRHMSAGRTMVDGTETYNKLECRPYMRANVSVIKLMK